MKNLVAMIAASMIAMAGMAYAHDTTPPPTSKGHHVKKVHKAHKKVVPVKKGHETPPPAPEESE